MVIKPFLLLNLAANTDLDGGCDQHCYLPSDVYDTHRRTKLTAPETISRWLLLKNRSEPPFRGLRGNITSSIACWKARGRLYIHHDWTFFAISYGWDVVISGNLLKSAFLEGVGSLRVQISEGRERRPPTTVGVRVAEWLPFHVVSKYPQCAI